MFKLGEQFCIAFSSLEVWVFYKNYDSVPLNALKILIIHGLNQRCLICISIDLATTDTTSALSLWHCLQQR
jgi:hypothetical protein